MIDCGVDGPVVVVVMVVVVVVVAVVVVAVNGIPSVIITHSFSQGIGDISRSSDDAPWGRWGGLL